MKKLILFLILVSILVIAACISDKPKVCIEENCFDVEVVVSTEDKMTGLMFREKMDEDKGMLFLYETSNKRNFWMKNTLIPLDIIWFDEQNNIVFISENTPPCEGDPCQSYGPNANTRNVLEINGGLANQLGIEIGDRATLINI